MLSIFSSNYVSFFIKEAFDGVCQHKYGVSDLVDDYIYIDGFHKIHA